MDVVLKPARKADAGVIGNLMQLYLHDFSEFTHEQVGDDGRYEYPYLPHYWEDPNRYPFLVRAADQVAGFALARFDADPATGAQFMDLAEFFVLRSCRRHGVGRLAARKLWDLFPGQWQLRVMRANRTGYAFWQPVISEYTAGRFTVTDEGSAVAGVRRYTFSSATDFDPPPDMDLEILDY